jgi:hypothetical protein
LIDSEQLQAKPVFGFLRVKSRVTRGFSKTLGNKQNGSFQAGDARPGIQSFQIVINYLDSGACPGLDPGFTGVTTFYKIIINYRLLGKSLPNSL